MPIQFFTNLYKRYERWVPIIFFGVGFVFDAVMLQRIDELATILQQALYLMISAGLIGVELIGMTRTLAPPPFLQKVWRYREAVLHFLLGTLLNGYTIFFFKSSSAITPYLFIAILITLLILNEFKRFGKSQAQVHMALLSLCLISYLVTLAPILIGFLGNTAFLSGIFASILVFSGYYRLLKKKIGEPSEILSTHLRLPFITILGIFVLLYYLHAIPPVPLSVKYMGIYHDVKKVDDHFELSYTRSSAKFWQNGDQTFLAREGDSIFSFVRIFSPTRFHDQIQVRWLYRDGKRGWLTSDVIAMPISGGREQGYRGVTRKASAMPGEWRVQVETSDNREVGRIHFTVANDTSSKERRFKVELQ